MNELLTSNVYDFKEFYVGHVLNINNYETGELEVFIPKLCPLLPRFINDVKFKNDLGEVINSNTISIKPLNLENRIPEKNSLVLIMFLDGNITDPFWFDFNPLGTNTYYHINNFTEMKKEIKNLNLKIKNLEEKIKKIKKDGE